MLPRKDSAQQGSSRYANFWVFGEETILKEQLTQGTSSDTSQIKDNRATARHRSTFWLTPWACWPSFKGVPVPWTRWRMEETSSSCFWSHGCLGWLATSTWPSALENPWKVWFCARWYSFKQQRWRWPLRQQFRGYRNLIWLPSMVSRGHDTLAVRSMREKTWEDSKEPGSYEDKPISGSTGHFVRHVGPSWSGHNWDSRTSSTSLGGYHWPFKWWRFSHSQYRWTPGCHELEAFHNHCHSFRAWGSNHELVWLRHGELEVFWRWFLSQHLCWPCGQWRLGNTRGTGFAGQSCQCISLQQTFQFKQELQSPRCTRIFRLSACCW